MTLSLGSHGSALQHGHVKRVVDALLAATDPHFRILRINNKVEAYPQQLMLNLYMQDFQAALEVQFNLNAPPADSHFYYDVVRVKDDV